MIALVDYGAGNLTSVKKALTALDAEFMVPSAPEECADVSGLIVPGVGHFSATTALGALIGHITGGHLDGGKGSFQPMNINYGLLPPLEGPKHGADGKRLPFKERGRRTDEALEIIGQIKETLLNNVRRIP